MRTLTRPMFNMGGPIKQGIMHGIREPKNMGGRMLLVGQHPKKFQDKSGREKHFAPVALAAPAAWTAARMAAMRMAPQALRGIKSLKNWFGKTTPASVTRGKHFVPGASGSYSPVTMNPSKFTPNWLGRDPLVQSAGWLGKSIFNPTTGGWAAKAARFATAPSSIIAGVAYYMWPDGKERTEPPTPGTGVPGGGDKGMYYEAPGKEIKVLSDADRKAFANKQRNERVQKYLDLMGYDRAKKTAIADALIDASKIVGDRGTLDKKNITQELINPIIQATSKRLDKPDQIREAVGLMATKAEIEKDLNKETKDLDRRYKKAQIAVAEEGLKQTQSFEGGLRSFISDRKGTVDPITLERISRLLADEHGETFTKIEEGTVPSGDGIYMIDSGVYRVTDGNAKQIA